MYVSGRSDVALKLISPQIIHKTEFGAWLTVPMRLLARMRKLRGTWLDVFGLSADRRLERELIREFESTIDTLLASLTADNTDQAAEVVQSYMDIRGYGPVKEQAVEEVRAKIASRAIMRA